MKYKPPRIVFMTIFTDQEGGIMVTLPHPPPSGSATENILCQI